MTNVFILHFPMVTSMLVNSQDELRELAELAVHVFLEQLDFEHSVDILVQHIKNTTDLSWDPSDDAVAIQIANEVLAWATNGFMNFVSATEMIHMQSVIQDILQANNGEVKLTVDAVDAQSIAIKME